MAMTEHAVVIAGGGPTGTDVGGRVGVGGRRRRHRRAAREPGPCRLARGWPARPHPRDSRSARDRRSLPLGGPVARAGRAVRPRPAWTSATFPPGTTLFARALAEAHRAHLGRLGRRAGVTDLSRTRGNRASRRTRPASTSRCPTASRCARSISSAATADAALIRKAAGIEFPGWDPTASCLLAEVELAEPPDRNGACATTPAECMPWAELSTRSATARSSTRISGPVRVMRDRRHVGPTASPPCAISARRSSPSTGPITGSQSHVDHPVHRHDAAGGDLPQPAGPAGRRRRARALAGGRTGPQYRRAGRGESRMEAGPGGQADVAGKPAGHLSRRAPPGRGPRAAQHDGASRADPPGRAHEGRCAAPSPSSSGWTSRANASPQ